MVNLTFGEIVFHSAPNKALQPTAKSAAAERSVRFPMRKNRSILFTKPITIPSQDRAHNAINGSDAESYALAKLVLACRGEGQWGSREEDNSKIDLIFSCPHPWFPNERMIILSQVKSGKAFGELTEEGFKLKGSAKNAATRTSHDVCVIWVDRDKKRVFWAYIHPDALPRPQIYGSHHEITPATIFDLARCMSARNRGPEGANGILVRVRGANLAARRKSVKSTYRDTESILSPVLGSIELSRLGWRHMFRSGRREVNKSTSLNLIPYLKTLLRRRPSTHAITANNSFTHDGQQYQVREHLLKFEKLKVQLPEENSSTEAIAHVRVIEEIRYPENWESQVMLSQMISRRVVLKSAYYKSKK